MIDQISYFYTSIPTIYTFSLLCKGLALCNFIHFLSWLVQTKGLIGERGILPVQKYLNSVKARSKDPGSYSVYWKTPTVFWLSASNRMLLGVFLFGVIISTVLLFIDNSRLLWFIIFVLSLSLEQVIQEFGLQMEPMMVELNALCFVASLLNGSSSMIPILLFRWFVSRMMLSAGLVKLYGSPSWKTGTAMTFHYLTQPLPNPISFYIHHIRNLWFHKLTTWSSLVIELPIVFLALFGTWGRLITFLSYTGLMFMINVTGNYGYLGVTSVVASISLLDDNWVCWVLGKSYCSNYEVNEPYFILWLIVAMLGVAYFVISSIAVLDTIRKARWVPPKIYSMYLHASNFSLINRYGMFGNMTEFRWEFIIEGSNDGTNWKRYGFNYKITNPDQRPCWVPFHWPRLDWHLWFLPLRYKRNRAEIAQWYINFINGILQKEKDILDLLAYNPFPNETPNFLRTQVFDYQFAPRDSEKNWWIESGPIGTYGPTLEKIRK